MLPQLTVALALVAASAVYEASSYLVGVASVLGVANVLDIAAVFDVTSVAAALVCVAAPVAATVVALRALVRALVRGQFLQRQSANLQRPSPSSQLPPLELYRLREPLSFPDSARYRTFSECMLATAPPVPLRPSVLGRLMAYVTIEGIIYAGLATYGAVVLACSPSEWVTRFMCWTAAEYLARSPTAVAALDLAVHGLRLAAPPIGNILFEFGIATLCTWGEGVIIMCATVPSAFQCIAWAIFAIVWGTLRLIVLLGWLVFVVLRLLASIPWFFVLAVLWVAATILRLVYSLVVVIACALWQLLVLAFRLMAFIIKTLGQVMAILWDMLSVVAIVLIASAFGILILLFILLPWYLALYFSEQVLCEREIPAFFARSMDTADSIIGTVTSWAYAMNLRVLARVGWNFAQNTSRGVYLRWLADFITNYDVPVFWRVAAMLWALAIVRVDQVGGQWVRLEASANYRGQHPHLHYMVARASLLDILPLVFATLFSVILHLIQIQNEARHRPDHPPPPLLIEQPRQYDEDGFDQNGRDVRGYNRDGIGRDGYDRAGFKDGRDPFGFDRAGFNRKGINRCGMDRDGYDIHGFDWDGFDRRGVNRAGYGHNGIVRDYPWDEMTKSRAAVSEWPANPDADASFSSEESGTVSDVTELGDDGPASSSTDENVLQWLGERTHIELWAIQAMTRLERAYHAEYAADAKEEAGDSAPVRGAFEAAMHGRQEALALHLVDPARVMAKLILDPVLEADNLAPLPSRPLADGPSRLMVESRVPEAEHAILRFASSLAMDRLGLRFVPHAELEQILRLVDA